MSPGEALKAMFSSTPEAEKEGTFDSPGLPPGGTLTSMSAVSPPQVLVEKTQ